MQFVVRFHTLLHQARAGLNEEELLSVDSFSHSLSFFIGLCHLLAHSLRFIVSFLHLEMTKENEAAVLPMCHHALN